MLQENTMKHLLTPMMAGLFIASTGMALATNVHTVTGTKGQPNQTIGEPPTGSATPGHASTAPGSAFNPDGNAGTHYAGEQDGINNKNPKSVSQYDVAGFQQSHNH
jgi:hypothetical protein